MEFLKTEDAILINSRLIGVLPPSNILKLNELDSAIKSIQATFEGSFLYPDIYSMAGHLMYSLAESHTFVDGNKRTAAVSGLTFLVANSISVSSSKQIQLAQILLKVLNHSLEEKDLVNFLKSM